MNSFGRLGLGCALAALVAGGVIPAAAQTVNVNQGPEWTDSDRQQFYIQDQGSRIMPLSWMQALKTPDGEPFLHDSLARYGYLPNPANDTAGIPVGFTLSGGDNPDFGMTCSACHTRQIEVNETSYRIDGGPGFVDFQGLLTGIDEAVAAAKADDAAFTAFAEAVLGQDASKQAIAELKVEVDLWYLRYHTLIERSLPEPGWGPARLDAVSMIFNRLTGLDIGAPPSYLIPDNIKVADAPTRYPFLWNAARQDRTQWPGFADNGNDILGLARNLGEVYGVFGEFHPTARNGLSLLNRDYLTGNSANFSGLGKLEDAIWKIGPPQWPWQIDQTLAARGEEIFNRATDDNGCVACHGIETGAFRSPFHRTWATPVQDVGTDTRECSILTHTVDTGTMAGAKIPLTGIELKPVDTAFNVLSVSVIGSILQQGLSFRSMEMAPMTALTDEAQLPSDFDALKGAFRPSAAPDMMMMELSPAERQSGCAYEARVMQGIWAAAPYLHNGSVPTLADLLKPAAERPSSFAIGPNYDLETIGLSQTQTKFDYVLETTDCSDLDSGNSRCGHEYGTDLSADEKLALLEYLKAL